MASHLRLSATVSACLVSWKRLLPVELTAIYIFRDLALMITWFSEQDGVRDGSIWTQPERSARWPSLLLHRCLQLSKRTPFNSDMTHRAVSADGCGEHFQDALRTAILLFLACIRRRYGVPAAGEELWLRQLRPALQSCLKDRRADAGLQRLIFWMLIVGGMETSILNGDVSWYCSRIVARCALVGATNLEEIKNTIERAMTGLVWLDEVMAPGLALLMENIQENMPTEYASQ